MHRVLQMLRSFRGPGSFRDSVSFTDGLGGWSLISGMESGSCVAAGPDREAASPAALVRAHLASVVFEFAHPMAFLLRAAAPLGSCGMGGATLIVRVDAISSDEKPCSAVGCTMSRRGR